MPLAANSILRFFHRVISSFPAEVEGYDTFPTAREHTVPNPRVTRHNIQDHILSWSEGKWGITKRYPPSSTLDPMTKVMSLSHDTICLAHNFKQYTQLPTSNHEAQAWLMDLSWRILSMRTRMGREMEISLIIKFLKTFYQGKKSAEKCPVFSATIFAWLIFSEILADE